MRFVWLCFYIFFFPASANAAFYFTEIAWMGSAESSSHEWIELYNDGGSEDLEGWQVTDDNNLTIDLSGVIQGNSHVVLERSTEESAPGSAFLIYTGALVNSGATIRLLREDGSVADQVSGGEDWKNIGGDNSTKETAQYTSGGWKTGVATPGTDFNGQVEEEKDEEENYSSAENNNQDVVIKKTSSKSSGVTKRLSLPDVSLKLDIQAPATGYVNQPIYFDVEASGIGDTLIDSLEYEWNFGDSNVANSKSPQHVFRYPGKYVVTLYGKYKRQEQATRKEITILPIVISLGRNTKGDIIIHNDSKYEVDISNYLLQGRKSFQMPSRTIVLPNQSIVINKNLINENKNHQVRIYDAERVLVDTLLDSNTSYNPIKPKPVVIDVSPAPMISAVSTESRSSGANERFGFVSAVAVDNDNKNIIPESNNVSLEKPSSSDNKFIQSASVADSSSPLNRHWPYLSLIVIMFLAILGIIVTKKSK